MSAQLTSLSDLFAHQLHRPPDARTVCNIQQKGLQSGGGRSCQIGCTFLCETCSHDVEAFCIQLPGQQMPEAAVTASDEHVLLAEAVHLVGISDEPADGSESDQQYSTGYSQVGLDYLEHKTHSFDFITPFISKDSPYNLHKRLICVFMNPLTSNKYVHTSSAGTWVEKVEMYFF